MNVPTATEPEEQSEPVGQTEGKTPVREVQLAEAPADTGSAAGGQFDILLDMSVPISVVLGEIQIPIRRLLQLGPGSVLKLEKSIETPADLYLKDSKFAQVDVVVVEDRFAVRIKNIIGAGAPASP
jgi:flagellar motor switch protein FliN/FliY